MAWLWHGLDDTTCVRSLGVAIWPYLHPSISTALMRPRRPKQYCLQLVIYIYIYKLNLSDECVSTKLRVTGNHACFILNCISLHTNVY